MRVLCIGDVVSRDACDFLISRLPGLKRRLGADFTIVNGENSALGNGIDKDSYDRIIQAGADIITGGNHSFQKRGAGELHETAPWLLRPLNLAGNDYGRGVKTVDCGRYCIKVLNLCGSLFMPDGISNPFLALDEVLAQCGGCINIVDFHAEASGEKRALGYYADGRVSLIFGTHTHVQTSDAQILPHGTGYITDIGMTGVIDSVLGKDVGVVVHNFAHPEDRAAVKDAAGRHMVNGIIAEIDEKTRRCIKIECVYEQEP